MEIFTFTVTLVYCVRVQIFHLSEKNLALYIVLVKTSDPQLSDSTNVIQFKRWVVKTPGNANVMSETTNVGQ